MEKHLLKLLSQYAQQQLRPDGSSFSTLFHGDEKYIAETTGVAAKDIQIAALQQDIIPERYCRNQRTLTNADQIKLLQGHVAIIGQGGLGGTVTEILARIGLGHLTLVDGDVFEESNLNRQILSHVGNLGKKKAREGRKRVKRINPAVEVKAVTQFLTPENSGYILKHADIAVDCLDSIPARFVLEDACRRIKIPLVSAAIAGTCGQATVIFPQDPGLRQIYGLPASVPEKGIETQRGTLPFAAVYMAAVECAEIVSIICTRTSKLRNNLLMTDIAGQYLEIIRLST